MPIPKSAPSKPFRLGLLLFSGCMPSGLFATADLVRACNLRAGREGMSISWVSVDDEEISTHRGPALRAQSTIAEAECDAWLLPGVWLASTDALEGAIQARRRVIESVRSLPRSTPVWSYCAGVALAAAAGRLDGQAATATWWLQPALAARFPRVQWRSSPDLVISTDAITASGPSGYLPLMLNRLALQFPADVLLDVQELLMLPSPRMRHPAFESVDLMAIEDPAMRSLLMWAQQTAAQDVTLAGGAQQLNVSVRTLCRQVQRATGVAAGDWLRRVKLAQAAEALRSTRTPIKVICDQLGFGSEVSLYRAFKAVTGLTPSEYRHAFGMAVRDIDVPAG